MNTKFCTILIQIARKAIDLRVPGRSREGSLIVHSELQGTNAWSQSYAGKTHLIPPAKLLRGVMSLNLFREAQLCVCVSDLKCVVRGEPPPAQEVSGEQKTRADNMPSKRSLASARHTRRVVESWR